MRKATSFAALWIVASVSGCSLLVDTAPYLGDDARTDGGVGQDGAVARDGATGDGSVDPEAPSKPEIQITPEEPRTHDPLRVEIVTESQDPLSDDPVTYEYAWRVDDAETEHASETVPASETRKGQRWSVSVVAVSNDGARRSEPATASVTIRNTPPTVMTVGLSQYRPVEGETLVATPGVAHDADGDALVFRYAWLKNGELIEGQSTDRLNLGSVGAEPDDRIEVELRVSDREEDAIPVSAGPAVVREDVTRWRQLLPERIGTFRAFDPLHRRVLLGAAELDEDGNERLGMWEYSLDSGRFVKLHPAGEAPAYGSQMGELVTYDAIHQRLLVFGLVRVDSAPGFSVRDVFAFDLRQRGAERWSLISEGEEGPNLFGAGVYMKVAPDEARQRLLVYGSLDFVQSGAGWPEPVVKNDVWELNLSDRERARWSTLEAPPLPEPIVFPLFVNDTERDRALLIGGARWDMAGNEPPNPRLTIYSLSLSQPETGFALEEATLPRPVGMAHHWIEDGKLHVFSGLEPDDEGTFGEAERAFEEILTIDLETFEISSRPIVGDLAENRPPLDLGGSFVFRDSGAERLLLAGNGHLSTIPNPFRILALDPSTSELTPIHRTGIDLPGALRRAVAVRSPDDGLLMYGGIDQEDEVSDELWRFESGAWTRMNPMADANTNRRPGPRAGVVLDSEGSLQFVSGVSGPEGELANMTPWLLDGSRWVEQTLAYGVQQPEEREGAMLFGSGCSEAFSYFGGRRYSPFDDAQRLSCESDGRQCTWSELIPDPGGGSVAPGARAYGAIARFSTSIFGSGRVYLFGGEYYDGSPVDDTDVWSLPVGSCNSRQWRRETVLDGLAPSSRFGSSMTAIGRSSLLVFGGIPLSGDASNELKELVPTSNGVNWNAIPLPERADAERILGRGHHVAVYDSRRERLLIYGGQDRYGNVVMSDMWELRFRPEEGD